MVYLANDIQNQICRETLCLEDSKTVSVCEIPTVADQYDYSLSSTILFVRDVALVTEELMTLDVKPATAWSAGDTITGSISTKTCVIVEKLTDYTYVVEHRTGTYTGGEILSNGTVTADQSSTTYPIFSDYEVASMSKDTTFEMNKSRPAWRTADHDKPTRYILDYNTGYITLYPKPDAVYTLRLSVYRYPITTLTVTNMSAQTPEIDSKYHNLIIDGICSKALLKRGENTYDPQAAASFFALFQKGIRDIKIRDVRYKGEGTTSSPNNAFM